MGICTNDYRLVILRESGTEENKKYELFSYYTEDGSVSQILTLSFIPEKKGTGFNCNDKYLAMMDVLGNVHIYGYSHVDSEFHTHSHSDSLQNLQA